MSELRTPEVEDLLTVFSKIQDKDDIFLLLEDLFTIREIRETSQRLAVARQLDAGNSYASIEKATGASATTIARVSKCLSYGAGGYTMALNILDDARKGKKARARREYVDTAASNPPSSFEGGGFCVWARFPSLPSARPLTSGERAVWVRETRLMRNLRGDAPAWYHPCARIS